MSYRKDIITAITALKNGSRSGPTSIAIKKQILANLPKDSKWRKWNNTAFLNELKKMTQRGHLVRFKGGHYKFSADFEKKLLEEKAAAAEQERLKDEAAAAKRKRLEGKTAAAKLKLEEEAATKKAAEKKRLDDAAKARERARNKSTAVKKRLEEKNRLKAK